MEVQGKKPGSHHGVEQCSQAILQTGEQQYELERQEQECPLVLSSKEFGFYPEDPGGPLKDSKRGNGMIASHPGEKSLFDSVSHLPISFLAIAQWALLGKTGKCLYPLTSFLPETKPVYLILISANGFMV